MWRWVLAACCVAGAGAQQVISTRAGLVQRVEGRAQVSDVGPEGLPTNMFVHLEPGQRMRTLRGRGEIVLAPGAYARFGGNSEIELVSADFEDVRVRLVEGSLVADLADGKPGKDYSVTLLWGDLEIQPEKRGEYEIVAREGAPAELRIHDGKAFVRVEERSTRVTTGKKIVIEKGGWGEERELSIDDGFRYRLIDWSRRRRAELQRGLTLEPLWTDEAFDAETPSAPVVEPPQP